MQSQATLAEASMKPLSLALVHGGVRSCSPGIPLDERFEALHGGALAAHLPPHFPVCADDRSLEARLPHPQSYTHSALVYKGRLTPATIIATTLCRMLPSAPERGSDVTRKVPAQQGANWRQPWPAFSWYQALC